MHAPCRLMHWLPAFRQIQFCKIDPTDFLPEDMYIFPTRLLKLHTMSDEIVTHRRKNYIFDIYIYNIKKNIQIILYLQ
ncbi:hypothetical protein ANTPLA_LOCUS595 [Anthophora plagiata]